MNFHFFHLQETIASCNETYDSSNFLFLIEIYLVTSVDIVDVGLVVDVRY